MANTQNRGNPSGTNSNMPSGVTKNTSTSKTDNVSTSVLNAITTALGTPLSAIKTNTADTKKEISIIKKELLGFVKNTEKTTKTTKEKLKEDKNKISDFAKKRTDMDKLDDAKNGIKSFFSKASQTFSGITKGIKDVFDKNKDSLQGLLGPLNLILSPLQDFFGSFGKIFKNIGGGIKGIFGKFKKKNPNSNDVIKSGAFGVGSLYIANILQKLFGKKNSLDKQGGKLDAIKGLFGKGGIGKGMVGGVGALGKTLAKVAGPMAIATALIMMAIDAIKGIFKSKEWGVSKVSGGLGSFFGGASEGGLKNAFASMGKWALLGAGIGSVVPVIGTIAGGLVGGAIGMILGAIGGKRLAKGFDVIGNFVKEYLITPIVKGVIGIGKWFKDVVITSFIEMIDDMLGISKFKKIFQSDDSIGKKIGKTLGLLVMTIVKLPFKFLTSSGNFYKKIFKKTFEGKDVIGALRNFGSSIINGLGKAWEGMKNFGSKVWEGTKNIGAKAWEGIKEFGSDVWEGITESELGEFVKNIFNKLKDGISTFFKENPVGIWVKSSIIDPIAKALGTIGDFFGFISDNWDWRHPIDSLTKVFGGFKEDKNTGLSEFDIWRGLKYTEADDAIIKTDGSIIKTNPKDTLVALKDVPLSMDKVRTETNKNLNSSILQMERDGTLDKRLTTIIDVLSKILAKDVQVQMPPQTRNDLDVLMSGGMI